MLGWGLKWKKDLLRLLKRLREENWDLYNNCRQREEAKRASDTTTRKDKDFSDQDPMLAQSFAIRGMAKILYDRFWEMASCSCHCIYLQLRCDTTSGNTLEAKSEAKSEAKFVLPTQSSRRHLPAIIGSIQFPLIIANISKRDGSIEEETPDAWDIHIIVESKLMANKADSRVVPLKRLASTAPDLPNQEGQERKKKIRFADNQTIITSSSWAIVTIPDDVDIKDSLPEVVSLEPSRVGMVSQSEGVSKDASTKLEPKRASGSESKPGLGGLGEGELIDLTGDKLQQESIRVLERLPFRFKFRAGKGSETITPSPELEKPEKESRTNPKGKGKQAAIIESEPQEPKSLPEKVSVRHEVGESSKTTTHELKHQKPKPKTQSSIARLAKSRVWKSLIPASDTPKLDPVEMKLLTQNFPEATTERPGAAGPMPMVKIPKVKESNTPDVKRAQTPRPRTAKHITVIPEAEEASVVDIEGTGTPSQNPSTTKLIIMISEIEEANIVDVEGAEAQKPSTTKPITVISGVEEANIPNVKGADIVSAEPNTPETAVQAPDLPATCAPKTKS